MHQKRRTFDVYFVNWSQDWMGIVSYMSNRPNWQIQNPRDFRHAMDMKFYDFLTEYRELRTHCGQRDKLGFCPDASHTGAARDTSRQNVRGGRCLNHCTKGAKYALRSTVQTTLAKAINGNTLKAVIVEAHPYALSGVPTASSTYQSVRTDISISTAETPGEVLYYVDTTVTNGQQKKIPKRKKLSVNDNIVCCQNLLLNQTVSLTITYSVQLKQS